MDKPKRYSFNQATKLDKSAILNNICFDKIKCNDLEKNNKIIYACSLLLLDVGEKYINHYESNTNKI